MGWVKKKRKGSEMTLEKVLSNFIFGATIASSSSEQEDAIKKSSHQQRQIALLKWKEK